MQYKIIENYSQYLIYEDGSVFNMMSGKYVAQSITGRYSLVSLASDTGIKSLKRLHRVVAIAFLKAPDFSNAVVNHKDGDKFNNHHRNLEWVTQSDNTLHAHSYGLNKKSKRTTVVWPNSKTTTHYSTRAAAIETGISITHIKRKLRKSDDGCIQVDGFTFNVSDHLIDTSIVAVVYRNLRTGESGRYDSIKKFLMEHDLTRHKVGDRLVYPAYVVHGDGYQIRREKEFRGWEYIDVSTLTKHFKQYDARQVSTMIPVNAKSVQIKWLDTEQVETFSSQLAISRKYGVNVTKLSQKLATGKECIILTKLNRFFLLRYKTDTPWRVIGNVHYEYAVENGSRAVIATHVKTKETHSYISMSECHRAFGITMSQMKVRLYNAGKTYGDYYFNYICECSPVTEVAGNDI